VIQVSLAGTAGYVPETVVDREFFEVGDGAGRTGMFRGPAERRHVLPGEGAPDMIEKAARKLADRLGVDLARDVDLILTNVSVPDELFTGCGAVVARRLGCAPKMVLDLHNSGCVSFVYMMDVARSLMTATGARSALICNVQTAAGRIYRHPDNRARAQAPVPGDGCGVGLLIAGGESPVLSISSRVCADYAEDMRGASDDHLPYWEPRTSPLYLDFSEDRVAAIVARGNKLVPEAVRAACDAARIETSDLDVLVTNQPNPIFLRNWREALLLSRDAHVDTYEEHGNLFGAAIPICLERAVETGKLTPGKKVALGGFSHAGDYAAAAIVHWQAG